MSLKSGGVENKKFSVATLYENGRKLLATAGKEVEALKLSVKCPKNGKRNAFKTTRI